jgi:uncharacterized protein
MAARFEIKQNGRGEFRFVLTSNGRVLATSESYTRKSSCLNAIESLRKAAASASVAENAIQTAPVAKAARAAGRAVGKAKGKVTGPAPKARKAATPAKRSAGSAKAQKTAAPRKQAAAAPKAGKSSAAKRTAARPKR